MSDISRLGLVALADGIAAGDVTSESATAAALDRLESVGRHLNAVVAVDREGALAAARAVDLARRQGDALGPLAGVPLAHKDLFYRRGRVSACGSLILRDFRPDHTATVLERLDAAGAIDVARLHLAEFAMSPTGFSAHLGHGLNPWSLVHCPGGSSSGSGAAVAARLVPAALGTDTGGSVRHPAAMCGVTGLKPTVGLVSNHGVMPLVPSFDCVGPLCRSARDAARMLAVIAGPDPADGTTALAPRRDYESGLDGQLRGLRIAVPQRYYRDALDTEIERLTGESLRVLADAGATLVETDVPDMAALNALAAVMVGVEAATLHQRWLEERPHDYADQVRARIEPGLHYPAVRYAEALMLRGAMAGEWLAAAMGDADVVHVPTLPVPVPTIEATTSGTPADVAAAIGRLTHCTRAVNYLGFPAMAVPSGFTTSGLPASMQLIGRPFAEATLIKVADAYQRLTDWHDCMPPLATSVAA